MKKIIPCIFFCLLFITCEDEDPTTVSLNYITACNEVEFTVSFSNTNFWDEDNAVWYNFNGPMINPITGTNQFCRKYIDESTVDQNDPFNSIDGEKTNDSGIKVINNPDGTQDIEFYFCDEDTYLFDSGMIFGITIPINNIDNTPLNQPVIGSEFSNCWIERHNFGANWTFTFTQKDVVNHIYAGTLICNWDLIGAIPIIYPQGTSVNFSATIDFSIDM